VTLCQALLLNNILSPLFLLIRWKMTSSTTVIQCKLLIQVLITAAAILFSAFFNVNLLHELTMSEEIQDMLAISLKQKSV
jgi:hypothetical protein